MRTKKFLTSWSGGKDSCYAYMQAVNLGLQPVVLLNILNENGEISRSHAIPKEILRRQAEALGISIITEPASWQEYERIFTDALREIKSTYQADAAVFGDIDLQAHRDWEEKVCWAARLEPILPLWKRSRKELVIEMINEGIETYIVSCNETMGESFLGRRIDLDILPEFEKIGVDACGENGEYHTLVVNCPLFTCSLPVTFGRKQKHEAYWFIDMTIG